MFEELDSYIPPCPNSLGVEGHGEGLKYQNNAYYYRTAKPIPKNKPAVLKWEGNWCSRQHGDVEYIIVAFNGKKFVVIEHEYPGSLQLKFKRVKNLSCEKAISLSKEIFEKNKLRFYTSCKHCKGNVIVLEDKQPKDVCLDCFRKGKA